MFVIKYTINGQYFNITGRGLDVFNIGLNPKLYKTIEDAQKDIEQFDTLKQEQINVFLKGDYELEEISKPIWYDTRHERKLSKREQARLDWYETARTRNNTQRSFFEKLSKDQLVIEEYNG